MKLFKNLRTKNVAIKDEGLSAISKEIVANTAIFMAVLKELEEKYILKVDYGAGNLEFVCNTGEVLHYTSPLTKSVLTHEWNNYCLDEIAFKQKIKTIQKESNESNRFFMFQEMTRQHKPRDLFTRSFEAICVYDQSFKTFFIENVERFRYGKNIIAERSA